MMREVFEEVIVEFWEFGFLEVKEREFVLFMNFDIVFFIFGFRRVGKIYFFYVMMKRFMGFGFFFFRRFFYVNFEDERFVGMMVKDFFSIVEFYYKYNFGVRVFYFFFDEV